MPAEAVKLVAGVATAFLLAGTIMAQNVVAGFLVLLTTVPVVIAFSVVAAAERDGWPKVAQENRRSGYLRELLLQQRPATELATLGTGPRIAALVSVHRRRAATSLDAMIRTAIRAEVLAGLTIAVLLGAALVVMLTAGTSTASAAATVVGVLSGLQAVRSTGYAFGVLMTAVPRAESVSRLIGPTNDGATRITSVVDRLEVSNLTVAYGLTTAVREVGFTVRRGEMVALVGANGAGKTTTINAVLGIVTPAAGTVLIDGQPAADLGLGERLGRFGLLTQEFGRYELTVRQNLQLGATDEHSDAELWTALRSVGAASMVLRLADRLDHQLGPQWGGAGLSGGQWQRLALARIHLRNPGVWILDEPTSSVDAETEEIIFDELHRHRADRITIVVSHRAWTLARMDRIHVFDQGRIVESGTFGELVARGGRFTELFTAQLAPPGRP